MPSLLLSRWIWRHHAHVIWASAAVVLISGVIGAKNLGDFIQLVTVVARVGVAFAFALFVVAQILRWREPGFTLKRIVSDEAEWGERSPLVRAGYTLMFLGLGGISAFVGALIGAMCVVVWK